ncbi:MULTISPECIES: ribosome-associated translation inhibitor RaiA [unclassified Thalassotalea]|uniref:ribosome hibernation-promoting factor, HPF/YfiA family n=1 Tax=unclassified Thalassotalea TaxID=2614972 RepID=UPI0010822254|nr:MULTISPECIES: ribosome-associated translation inhibitor RaiA [unclassified Thalassotalea]NMP17940.1 ribosome-associated translation inhibitor RaiA [Thalassotalea sp. Y01]QBY03282.1 ribosome-associated translation inhibitor RaiA [Thalassotalea sp. HSM 43]
MRITISGHHVEVTEAITDVINSRFAKIANHFPSLMSLEVILKVDKNSQKIEAVTNYENMQIAVSAKDDDLYIAIGSCVKKMEAALQHRKGVLKANLHSKIKAA